jgi:hypothetical protein
MIWEIKDLFISNTRFLLCVSNAGRYGGEDNRSDSGEIRDA